MIDITRYRRPELMDDPALDGARHEHALRGLARINSVSSVVRLLWLPMAALVREIEPRTLRILDVATGAGDVPIGLGRRAKRTGLRLEIDACDASPRALEHARRRADQAGVPIRLFLLDAVSQAIPAEYDVVISSLFLHHLDETPAVTLLRSMCQATRRLLLVNDLRRSLTGLIAAHVVTRLLTTSPVVHVDGPRSMRAAYTARELRGLAAQAGMPDAVVSQCWPWRLLLQWRRS